MKPKKVIIVGAGPAGLFCAYLLLKKGFLVDLYDQSSGPGKKFLIAGNGGLNLTHSEGVEEFCLKYGRKTKIFKDILNDFSSKDLVTWFEKELGVETFIGSSCRVFPKKMKAGEALIKWLEILKKNEKFNLYLNYKFIKINMQKELIFEHSKSEVLVKANYLIFSLGGASWKKTGSDGLWKGPLEEIGVKVNKFLPMNCGFERKWSTFFKENIKRSYVKYVEVSFKEKSVKGDLMLTPYGMEGGPIYALSNLIRDNLGSKESCIYIDLKPGLSLNNIYEKLEKKKTKVSLSNHLRKALGLEKNTFILLKELLSPDDFKDMKRLSYCIKNLRVSFDRARPIDEAISTSGGVCFSNLSSSFEFKKIQNIYFCGEMLDYEAPTGGYLLQSCFSTAWRVVSSITSK